MTSSPAVCWGLGDLTCQAENVVSSGEVELSRSIFLTAGRKATMGRDTAALQSALCK